MTAPDLMELGERLTRVLIVGLLAVVIMAGSAFVWIGIPLAGLWAAGELTDRPSTFLLVILLVVPSAMAAFAWLLYRVNGLYEQLLGRPEAPPTRSAWLASSSEERRTLRRARGPRTLLDVSMTASAVVALVLMSIWFFFLADTSLAPLP